jgi:hypothetical protein
MAASNTVGGIGELQFTIQGPCGDIQLTRQIHVGGADPNRIVAASQWGPPIVRQIYASTTTFAEVNYEVPVLQLEGSILEYEWAIWNHSQWDISPQHWGGVPYAEVEIDYWPFPLPSQQSIYIRARNTCGWGNWAETIWEVSGGWRYAFSLYPNPVSEELNLSMLDDARIGSLPKGETYSLTIYNEEGSMVYREADVSQSQQKINVRHWKQGTYYLHLLHKEGEMRRRFVVER